VLASAVAKDKAGPVAPTWQQRLRKPLNEKQHALAALSAGL
jgi:hypothetical protein